MSDDEKVYTAETIPDIPLPGSVEEDSGTSQETSNESYSQKKIKDTDLPTKRVAVELLSSVLNTKSRKILGEFELADSGGIRVGKYQTGISGELVLTPAGITAKNQSGLTTFSIDAETGDAVFAGTIQSGAIIAGEVIVGNGNIVIDGENNRIVIFDDDGVARILIGYQKDGF